MTLPRRQPMNLMLLPRLQPLQGNQTTAHSRPYLISHRIRPVSPFFSHAKSVGRILPWLSPSTVQIGVTQSNTHMSLDDGEYEDSDGSEDSNNIVAAIFANRKAPRDIQMSSTPATDSNVVSTSALLTTSGPSFINLGTSNLKWGSFIVGNFLDDGNSTMIPIVDIDTLEDQTGTSTHVPTPEVPPPAKGQEPINPESRKRPLLTEGNIEAHNSMHPPMCPSKSKSKQRKSHRDRHRHRSRDRDGEKSYSTQQVGPEALPRHTSASDGQPHRKKRRHEEDIARSSRLQRTPVPLSFDQQLALTPSPRSVDRHLALTPAPQSVDRRHILTPAPRSFDQRRVPTQAPHSSDQQRVPANIRVPTSILHRENYKAIKHTPITAGGKARTHLDQIQQRRSRNQATTVDEDLFKAFEAQQPKQKRNQIVDGLVAPEKQVEIPYNNYPTPANPFNSYTTPTKRAEAVFGAGKPTLQPRTNTPKKQNAVFPPPIKTQKAFLLQHKNQKANAGRSNTQAQPQEDSPPRELSPPIVLPPVETVLAEDFLGPERLVRQWVVYRTPRFSPTITSQSGEKIAISRDDKAVRCSDHISKNAANDNAHARYERIRKDVVKKSWELAGESGLYDGVLGYSDGDVQHFWVVEEVADLTKISNQWKEAGKSLRLDQERAKVYSRKRYDVWSVVVCPADVQGSAKNGQEQVLVVDCGGEEDKDEEMEDSHDDDDNGKEDKGGSRSPASSDTVVEQYPNNTEKKQEPNTTEKEQPEASPENLNLNLNQANTNNTMVSVGVNTDETSITTNPKPPTPKLQPLHHHLPAQSPPPRLLHHRNGSKQSSAICLSRPSQTAERKDRRPPLLRALCCAGDERDVLGGSRQGSRYTCYAGLGG